MMYQKSGRFHGGKSIAVCIWILYLIASADALRMMTSNSKQTGGRSDDVVSPSIRNLAGVLTSMTVVKHCVREGDKPQEKNDDAENFDGRHLQIDNGAVNDQDAANVTYSELRKLISKVSECLRRASPTSCEARMIGSASAFVFIGATLVSASKQPSGDRSNSLITGLAAGTLALGAGTMTAAVRRKLFDIGFCGIQAVAQRQTDNSAQPTDEDSVLA